MDLYDRYASRIPTPEDVAEPFGKALRDRLSPHERVQRIIFSPSFTSLGERAPASLLVIADQRWLILQDDDGGNIMEMDSSYRNTQLLEITRILLYGQFKIDFAGDSANQFVTVYFNTVMSELFYEAIGFILDGINGTYAASNGDSPDITPLPDKWPMKFRSALRDSLPKGHRILDAVHWPSLHGGFHRELAPAAVLAATDLELMLVSEEKAWSRYWQSRKMGTVTTYLPLKRLSHLDVHSQERMGVLDVELNQSHGGESLRIIFPPACEADVTNLAANVSERINAHNQ